MEITINIKKTHFIILCVLICMLGVGIFAYQSGGPPDKFGHSIEEIEGLEDRLNQVIPSGFCIFSSTATSCPQGWEMKWVFNGRTIRGVTDANAVGKTGGNEGHSHSIWIGDRHCSGGSKSAVKSGTWWTDWRSNWPPYVNVIICCKK